MREQDMIVHNTAVKRAIATVGKKRWIYGYVWKGADRAYIIPSNFGVNVNDNGNDTVSFAATAIPVFPDTISSPAMCCDCQDRNIYYGDYVEWAGEIWEVQLDEKKLCPCLVRKRPLRNGETQTAILDKQIANKCLVTGNIFDKFFPVRVRSNWHLAVDGEILENVTIPLSAPIPTGDVLALLITKFHHKESEEKRNV